jgi:hypothetical protein
MLRATAHGALFGVALISAPTRAKAARDDVAQTLSSAGNRRRTLLQTIAVILVVLWLLGFVTSYTMGGFIHILLVVAVVMILVRIIQGRRVL